MRSVLATASPRPSQVAGSGAAAAVGAMAALVRAGFRRYATYRQATAAAIFTNSVFGFLRCYVLLAAVATSATGSVAATRASSPPTAGARRA